MVIVGNHHIITNWRTGRCFVLTRAELERFFDNRDPRDWII